jgi:hypothetical protein
MERKGARSSPAPATLVLAAASLLLVDASGVALRADDLRQQSGPYAITLQLPQAGLFAGEEMEIEFKVEKADGTPLPWGRIRGVVDMPSMPSMPRFYEIAHREGIPGVFGVHPTFPHGGDYRLCLTVLPPEVQPVGDPRPTESFTFEFPLTVWDSAASPTRESRKIKPFALDVVATPRRPSAGEPVELELRIRMATSLELREVTDFDLQHERLMHLFVVSEDLSTSRTSIPSPRARPLPAHAPLRAARTLPSVRGRGAQGRGRAGARRDAGRGRRRPVAQWRLRRPNGARRRRASR